MEFAVLYIDGTGKTGSVSVSWKDYDILAISRAVKALVPGCDVRCIIPKDSTRR